MSYFDSIASTINYFNNLINNQIAQAQFNSFLNQAQANSSSSEQTASGSSTATQAPPAVPVALSNALSSLAGLLNSTTGSSVNVTDVSNIAYTVDKLVAAGASNDSIQSLLSALSGDTGDILYTRTGSDDPNITLQNRVKSFGGDLQSFLSQATQIAQRGGNINNYIDAVTNVVGKGDYDDLRRFISVTSTVMYRGEELEKFYGFTGQILDKRHYDMESNIFSVQTMLGQGLNLDSAIKIMSNMENTGMAGRNNMVDLNRVTIDARNQGAYMPYFLMQMADSGDTRTFLDSYMAAHGMETTAPDFNKFNRIERIDGEDMVITEGESAALFAQAISSRDGLLPESVLYWSSMQTGAISNGSSYLDLSKLGPGTYDIYVKIGRYAGGTDTAKKRVIILPKDDDDTKGNNGLGDTKDDDNTVKGDDDSNPGHNKTETVQPTIVQAVTEPPEKDKEKENNGLGDTKDSDNTVKFTDTSNPGHNKTETVQAPVTTTIVNNDNPAPANAFNITPPVYFAPVHVPPVYTEPLDISQTPHINQGSIESDLAKLESLIDIVKDFIDDAYNFLNAAIGKEKVSDFLNNNGQNNLSKKYEKEEVRWFDMLLAMGRQADFYRKCCEEFRAYVNKDEARKYFLNKELQKESANKAIQLLGYDEEKENNGLGDTKDADNTVKFNDASNPGHYDINDAYKK